jgi:hypothetical protein
MTYSLAVFLVMDNNSVSKDRGHILSDNMLLENVREVSGFRRCVAETFDLARCQWVAPAQRVSPIFKGQNVNEK